MTGRRPLAQVVQRTSVGLLFGFAIMWLSNELSNWVIKKKHRETRDEKLTVMKRGCWWLASRWLWVMAMLHVGRVWASLCLALPNMSLFAWVVRAIAPLRQGIANDHFVRRGYP